MSVLGIIPCSKEKIWDIDSNVGAVPAHRAYRSSFHCLAQKYIVKHSNQWVIFSAKYGLILPHFIIPKSYDITFSRPTDPCISIAKLQQQLQSLQPLTTVVNLCPSSYANKIDIICQNSKTPVQHPLRGVGGWGLMHRWLREQNVG